jgi:Flp pilus assembly protein TadD
VTDWPARLGSFLLALATTAMGAAASQAAPTVAWPDFTGMEPAVGRQLQGLAEHLAAKVAAGVADAGAWAECGRHAQAYALLPAALVCYRQAHALAPADPRLAYLLAVVESESGDEAGALAILAAAPGELATYLPAVLLRSRLLLATGDPAAGDRVLAPALAALPGEPSVLAVAGELALVRGDAPEAIRALGAALAAEPRATRLHYPLALAYRAQGDVDRAREHLAQVGTVGTRAADPWLDEVRALRVGVADLQAEGQRAFAAGDFPAARRAFARAVELAGGADRGALVNLAAAEARLGDSVSAREHLETARRLDPDSPVTLFNLGSLLLALDRPEEALPVLRHLVAVSPDDQEARELLVRTLRSLPMPAMP